MLKHTFGAGIRCCPSKKDNSANHSSGTCYFDCSAAPGTKPILRVLDSGDEYDASILSCTETPLLVYIISEETERPYGDFMNGFNLVRFCYSAVQ